MNQAIDPESWVAAERAAELLGVKKATLYAYVSRGLVASRSAGPGRARLYRTADLAGLRGRGHSTRGAERALRWGDPVLESSITEMTPEGPVYRGRPVLRLVEEGVSFESCSELLWSGSLPRTAAPWPESGPTPQFTELAALLPKGATPLSVASASVAVAAARDVDRFDATPHGVQERGRRLIRLIAASLALPRSPSRARQAWETTGIAAVVARALGAPKPSVAAINAALVLLADHELNASTFAARVAASTGADIYASVQAGLAALSGPLHGAVTDRIEALLAEAAGPEQAEHVVRERMRRGEPLPGFGHPYYHSGGEGTDDGRGEADSGGDPRGRFLLGLARSAPSPTEELLTLEALVAAMKRAGRPAPNVDLGLVALRAALGLPRGSAAALFCVGRCAGWIAHALEQAATGHLLRPRARYREA